MPELTDTKENKMVRLSLDLPETHHGMIDSTIKRCGFSSKMEAVRNAVALYEELGFLASQGYDVVLRDKTGAILPMAIMPFGDMARRARAASSASTSA